MMNFAGVVPMSHKWDREAPIPESHAVFTEMAAGSVVMWTGSTGHGGTYHTQSTPQRDFRWFSEMNVVITASECLGDNLTESKRAGLLCIYNQGWLKSVSFMYKSEDSSMILQWKMKILLLKNDNFIRSITSIFRSLSRCSGRCTRPCVISSATLERTRWSTTGDRLPLVVAPFLLHLLPDFTSI